MTRFTVANASRAMWWCTLTYTDVEKRLATDDLPGGGGWRTFLARAGYSVSVCTPMGSVYLYGARDFHDGDVITITSQGVVVVVPERYNATPTSWQAPLNVHPYCPHDERDPTWTHARAVQRPIRVVEYAAE